MVAIELISAARALRYRLAEDPTIVLGAGSAAMLPRLAPILDAGGTPGEEIEACVAAILQG